MFPDRGGSFGGLTAAAGLTYVHTVDIVCTLAALLRKSTN